MNLNRIRLIGLMGCVGILLAGCALPDWLTPVTFPDKALESAIRATIQKPFLILTKQDLLGVRELDARKLNIRELSGLENCRNLAWADFDTNQISDLRPLAQLGRPENPKASPLVYLNLDNNEVTDLGPLAGLLNLQGLSLFSNQVADIGPLVTNAMNEGLGRGDYVTLDIATLNDKAVNKDIPALRSLGVNVVTVTTATSSS